MNADLSLRAQAALGLLVCEGYLRAAELSAEDRQAAANGVELAWSWVEGKPVNPWSLCDYIDGDINLPYRSTLYSDESLEGKAMTAAFLSIGTAALYCCQETDKAPSQSVENFGANETEILMNMAHGLQAEYQNLLTHARAQLLRLTSDEAGKLGRPFRKSEVLSSGSVSPSGE